MPRFALLMHDSPRGVHYDLLLESGDSLKTWALPQLPCPGVEMECEALADHRSIYLDYEGPISEGRGSVVRWDRGTFEIEIWTSEDAVVQISGEKLAGRLQLRRLPENASRWRLKWHA